MQYLTVCMCKRWTKVNIRYYNNYLVVLISSVNTNILKPHDIIYINALMYTAYSIYTDFFSNVLLNLFDDRILVTDFL